MAIFKPLNCTPYFSSLDAEAEDSSPYYFYCKIEGSNLQTGLEITGYSITILDNENNQVFPQDNIAPIDNISLISDLKKVVTDEEGYTNLNTGINGSYLKIPIIVNSKDNKTTIGKNQITRRSIIENGNTYKWVITLFQGITKNESGELVRPTEIASYDMLVSSGYITGSYNQRIQSKFSDKIYGNYFIQPVRFTEENEETNFFDGSNMNEYIDIGDSNKKPVPVGTRGLIQTYDYSYGYIYPYSGESGLDESQIGDGYWEKNKADAFCVYKFSNDPEILRDVDKVDRYVDRPNMETTVVKWKSLPSNPGASYFTQEISMSEEEFNNYIETGEYPFEYNSSEKGDGLDANTISKNQRVIFGEMWKSTGSKDEESEGEPADGYSEQSPYNGIYTIPDIPIFDYLHDEYSKSKSYNNGDIVRNKEQGQYIDYKYIANDSEAGKEITDLEYWEPQGSSQGTMLETWTRTSDANTWGSLVTKIVLCSSNLITYQFAKYDQTSGKIILDVSSGGTINKTEIQVFEEFPIEIYPDASKNHPIEPFTKDYYATRYGKIFYNNKETLYISPFSGIENGMWFQQISPNNNSLIIKDFNSENWSIGGKSPGDGSAIEFNKENYPRESRYQLKTFFRSSDEIVFYTNDIPEITFHFYKTEKETEEKDELKEDEKTKAINCPLRRFYVEADYKQKQYIPWKSYYWQLTAENGLVVDQSETIYSGKIARNFYGLIENKTYRLKLVIETQNNVVFTKEKEIFVSFDTESLDYVDEQISLNCNTMAVDISMISSGSTLPTLTTDSKVEYFSLNETNDNTVPEYNGVTYENENAVITENIPTNGLEYEYFYSDVYNGNDSTVGYLEVDRTDDGKLPVTIKSQHTIRSAFYEGEIFGFEVEGGTSDRGISFSLYIPNEVIWENSYPIINKDRNYFYYNLNSYGKTFEDKKQVVNIKNKEDNKFAEDIFTLPNYLPKSGRYRNIYNYAPVVSCVVNGEYEYSEIYGNILGKYNIYNKLANSSERIPKIEFPILQKNNESLNYDNSFYDAEGEIYSIVGEELNDEEELKLFCYAPLMWSDNPCDIQDIIEDVNVNGESSYRKKNVIKLNDWIKWKDEIVSGDTITERTIWRDGDALEDYQPDSEYPEVNLKTPLLLQYNPVTTGTGDSYTVWYKDRGTLYDTTLTFDIYLDATSLDTADNKKAIVQVKMSQKIME